MRNPASHSQQGNRSRPSSPASDPSVLSADAAAGFALPCAALPSDRAALSDPLIDAFQLQIRLAQERGMPLETERVQAEFAAYLEANRSADQLMRHVPSDLRLDVCHPMGSAEVQRVSALLKLSVDRPFRSIQEALSRGCAWFQVGAIDCALQVFTRALATFELEYGATPARLQLQLNQGFCHLKLDRFQDARLAFREVLRHAPAKAPALRGHGIALMKLRQHTSAIVAFNRALEIEPHDSDLHYQLGTALLAAGRSDQSLDSLLYAQRAEPEDLAILHQLGRAQAQSGQPEEASGTFDHALALARGCERLEALPPVGSRRRRSRAGSAHGRRRRQTWGGNFLQRPSRVTIVFVSIVVGHLILRALGV